MEEAEKRTLPSYPGTPPSHRFTYVDNTRVKIKSQDVPQFCDHINSVNKHIEFTREGVKNDRLAFLDCEIPISNGQHLKVKGNNLWPGGWQNTGQDSTVYLHLQASGRSVSGQGGTVVGSQGGYLREKGTAICELRGPKGTLFTILQCCDYSYTPTLCE